jgi:hypothetical protein
MGLDMWLNREGSEIGYWRKANAIHKWFVDNTQNGEDKCETSNVSLEQIVTLLNICKKVLKDPEKNSFMLEPLPGFFFGTYNIDENYVYNIKQTIKILKKCLKYPESKFTYEASW